MFDATSGILVIAAATLALGYAAWRLLRDRRPATDPAEAPDDPREYARLLREHVPYYARLSGTDRRRFRERVVSFLAEVRVEGAGFVLDAVDRVLVAASAQMLLFNTDEWRLPGVREVLLQPTHFDDEGRASDYDADMLGMVGEEIFSRTVILSRVDLREGFRPGAEVHVGVHEFAHVIDRADGAADGCPTAYLPPARVAEWRQTLASELARARLGHGVLDPYAGEDPAELFAVATEHYFLYPYELRTHHRGLWRLLRRLYG